MHARRSKPTCRACSGWTAWRKPAARPPRTLDLRIKVAGFGGQGVLMLGEVLAEAGLEAGYEVSWLPSYGPEMRSGTSNCHVRLSSDADRFAAGLAAQRAARHERALPAQVPAGRGGRRHRAVQRRVACPRTAREPDVRVVARPVHRDCRRHRRFEGRQHRDAWRAAGATALLDPERVVGALRRLVKSPNGSTWTSQALERGREAVRSDDNYLWGV